MTDDQPAVPTETKQSRQDRKEAARKLKRQRIEEAGGVRPRHNDNSNNHTGEESTKGPSSESNNTPSNQDSMTTSSQPSTSNDDTLTSGNKSPTSSKPKTNSHSNNNNNNNSKPRVTTWDRNGKKTSSSQQHQNKHRFGRVMDKIPCTNKPRHSTLSIAVPGSVVSNAQTRELKTHLVGQIARAAVIYHVDEVIVFDDNLGKEEYTGPVYRQFRRNNKRREYEDNNNNNNDDTAKSEDQDNKEEDDKHKKRDDDEPRETKTYTRSDPHEFMSRILQYCECPQYLRRHFFPMHPDLQFAGLLHPIDSPHHVRIHDRCKYREGVVMDKKAGPNGGSYVNCGIRSRPVEIDRLLTPGIRCTVMIDVKLYDSPGKAMRGEVVSPSAPREDNGTYWGYTTRLADGIKSVLEDCPYEGGYDLKVGTSERGDQTVDDKNFGLPRFNHSLIVFGGVAGIEECVDADETLKISGRESKKLFDLWVNTCPFQGSRTIRTEEAVLLSLARMRPLIAKNRELTNKERQIIQSKNNNAEEETTAPVEVTFSDEEMSDESSDEE